jgi:formate-dependent nitrite reductase membrane component NrfD
MIQSKPYDFMVKNTPSREWSEGMGALIAVAFFLGGLTGGLYLVSVVYNNIWGMFIAWICALLMGIFDMAHLSKPLRFWRIIFRPGSSWISRGFIFITLFIGSTAIQLALSTWAPGYAETVFKWISAALAFGVAMYSGFVVSYVSGIKLWNSAVMPVLFLASGLVGGLAVLMAIYLFGTSLLLERIAQILQLMLVAYIIIIGFHLWVTSYSSQSAKDSVRQILVGRVSSLFWGIVIAVGVIIPLVILYFTKYTSATLPLMAVICVILGNLALRYVILKAGMYSPLVPSHENEYIE